ncbi:uncharacterized protein LOC117174967 [Belonocnema kinseyi]|uniref:uncharacterized protein LOC117174967 n=1 Tax=Belonocnema kinseyi TaxID=2817044 RepID=UPI00143DCB61|nr:uncharacterized protein LOC117174967 [Belonocnema kinseyi]
MENDTSDFLSINECFKNHLASFEILAMKIFRITKAKSDFQQSSYLCTGTPDELLLSASTRVTRSNSLFNYKSVKMDSPQGTIINQGSVSGSLSQITINIVGADPVSG